MDASSADFHNLGQNIRRLFHFLAKFLFTTSETELDYFHGFDGEYPVVQPKAKFDIFW